MSHMLDALRGFVAWWFEGLARIGAHLTHVYDGPLAPIDPNNASESDREAWEEERARLALSPWWM